jgi:hypothetical protein
VQCIASTSAYSPSCAKVCVYVEGSGLDVHLTLVAVAGYIFLKLTKYPPPCSTLTNRATTARFAVSRDTAHYCKTKFLVL